MPNKKLVINPGNHIGYVSKQPSQCKCLLCRKSMACVNPLCVIAKNDLELFLQFVATTRSWRATAVKIRETGSPSGKAENVVYRVVNIIGTTGLNKMKLTATIAKKILQQIKC